MFLFSQYIYDKYEGCNLSQITGTKIQPVSEEAFYIRLNNTNAFLRFCWESGAMNYTPNRDHFNRFITNDTWRFLSEDQLKNLITNESTHLYLELPDNRFMINIKPINIFNKLFSKLSKKVVKSGLQELDEAYIIQMTNPFDLYKIEQELVSLVKRPYGRCISLTTNHQDAVTTKFYLHLQFSDFPENEADLESLLHTCYTIRNRIFGQEKFITKS